MVQLSRRSIFASLLALPVVRALVPKRLDVADVIKGQPPTGIIPSGHNIAQEWRVDGWSPERGCYVGRVVEVSPDGSVEVEIL